MLSLVGVASANTRIPEASSPYRVALLVLAALLLPAQPANATFPGENGRIAYTDVLNPGTPQSRQAIFATDRGALSAPPVGPPTSFDTQSAWSPDGESVAFIRFDQTLGDYLIKIIAKDGTNEVQLLSSDAFDQVPPPGFENAQLYWPTWSPDGNSIAFTVRHPGRPNDEGIWTVATNGTGLVRRVLDGSADGADWSPDGTQIAYVCKYRGSPTLLPDLCAANVATGVIRRIPIDVVGKSSASQPRPKWTPDGTKIFFALTLQNLENNHTVNRSEVFAIEADGSPLTRITNTPDACPNQNVDTGGTTTSAATSAVASFTDPTPSPDGNSLVLRGIRFVASGPINAAKQCSYTAMDQGIWTMSASGSSQAVLVPGQFAVNPAWQPIPAQVTVNIDDGHGHPLKGLKVELLTLFQGIVEDNPLNTSGGTYAFENVAPGEYLIRATLIDHKSDGGPTPPPYTPSFEIRHGPEPEEAVWVEWSVTLAADATVALTRSFADSPKVSASSVDATSSGRERLDDLANLFFRTHQFSDWLKTYLTPSTGSTVRFHAFATTDPTSGNPVQPNDAYHRFSASEIVLGVDTSAYENRDGVSESGSGDDAPENVEWHEFTHHVYSTFVAPYDCAVGDRANHEGYVNPSSCDSMFEGFANFLPAYAALSIDGATDSDYDGMVNLEAPVKAWGLRPVGTRFYSTEDLAVPALYWDLVDASADTETRQVIAANGTHVAATFTDSESFPLSQIWSQLVAAKPRNVLALRQSFGTPAITLNLDGVAPADIAPLDALFIMHGFFPVELDQTITVTHQTYHYDVAYTQRVNPALPRNSHVGASSHVVLNLLGQITTSRVPRAKTPVGENASLLVDVRDASGTPLFGGDLRLQVQHPGIVLPQTVARRLGAGAGSLAHLELPAYFDYLLPSDAPLPACGAAGAVQVTVTATARLNGFASPDVRTFDNCNYWQAIAAATGPGALPLSFSFPEDSTPPLSAISASASTTPVGSNTAGRWTVSLTCSDPVVGGFASGCRPTEFRIDGGAIESFVVPVVLDEVGEHVIEYRSLDAAGNAEAFNTATFGVIGSGDSDTDGILDADELTLGTDPFDPDSDDDGLIDGGELSAGTNPLDADTDDDGALDGNEVANGTNPLDTDSDDDGDLDGADNCPRLFNPDQVDSGGLASSTPNGRGDVCECGDVTGNGVVDAADVTFFRSHLVGSSVPFAPPANGKCSVSGVNGSVCDVVDVTVMQRALLGALPALSGNCAAP